MEIIKSIKVKKFKKVNSWEFISYILLGVIISPIIYIFFNMFNKNSEYSDQIFDYLIIDYIVNTLMVVVFVGLFSTIIGLFLAYFEIFYEYKFRKFFKYVNILSFAIPSYLLGYLYSDMLTGPLYFHTGINLDIANLKGMIFILSLSFYPYVYLITRAYMKKISPNIIYAGKTLGKNNFHIFKELILPMSRPAIISSVILVIMESLNSFGVANYFGVEVFSTGIYKAWINAYDLDGAVKLSGIIMFVVFFIIFIERMLRNKYNYEFTDRVEPIKRERLTGKNEKLVIFFSFVIFSFSFLIPILYVFRLFYLSLEFINIKEAIFLTLNSLKLMFAVSLSILAVSLFILTVFRLKKNKYRWIISSIASLGYSIPGVVIAIGFLSIVIAIDSLLINLNVISEPLILKSFFVVVLAFMTRFMSLGYNGIEAGMKKIGNDYHITSKILGKSTLYTFLHIDLFMLKEIIFSSLLLVSIEVLKELPLSTILLNKNTLAIQMSNYAKDEEMVLIGLLALIMVSISFIMLVAYNYIERKDENE